MKCFTDMNLFDYVCSIFRFFVCFGVQSQWTHLPNTTSSKVQRKLSKKSQTVVKPRGLGSSLRVFFYFNCNRCHTKSCHHFLFALVINTVHTAYMHFMVFLVETSTRNSI